MAVPGSNIPLAGVKILAFKGHVKAKDLPGLPTRSISLHLHPLESPWKSLTLGKKKLKRRRRNRKKPSMFIVSLSLHKSLCGVAGVASGHRGGHRGLKMIPVVHCTIDFK